MAMGKVAVSFTGGKDSILALHLFAGYAHPSIPNFSPRLPASKASTAAAANGGSVADDLPRTAPADIAAARSSISLLVTFGPIGISSNEQGFKAHPLPVIHAQAAALQIPHTLCEIDPGRPLESYRQQIKRLHEQHGVSVLVTGDILDVAGGFMAKAVEGTGVELATPLWQLPRMSVLRALHDLGIAAYISCVDLSRYSNAASCCVDAGGIKQLQQGRLQATAVAVAGQEYTQQHHQQHQDKSSSDVSTTRVTYFDACTLLLGQQLTPQLLAGPLSQAEEWFGADMCGELGEYHTLVFDAPLFTQPLHLKPAEICASGSYASLRWELGLAV